MCKMDDRILLTRDWNYFRSDIKPSVFSTEVEFSFHTHNLVDVWNFSFLSRENDEKRERKIYAVSFFRSLLLNYIMYLRNCERISLAGIKTLLQNFSSLSFTFIFSLSLTLIFISWTKNMRKLFSKKKKNMKSSHRNFFFTII